MTYPDEPDDTATADPAGQAANLPDGSPQDPQEPHQPAQVADPEASKMNLEEMHEATTKTDPAEGQSEKTAADLEAVFDVPVRVSAVLGRAKIPVASLMKMDAGTVIELDRQVGEAIDILVNDRLVARGEIVLVDARLGVTMTEIIKAG
jgi:flagellar motor switch protein FliN